MCKAHHGASYHLHLLKAHKYVLYLLQVHTCLKIHGERCGRGCPELKVVDNFGKGAAIGGVVKRILALGHLSS